MCCLGRGQRCWWCFQCRRLTVPDQMRRRRRRGRMTTEPLISVLWSVRMITCILAARTLQRTQVRTSSKMQCVVPPGVDTLSTRIPLIRQVAACRLHAGPVCSLSLVVVEPLLGTGVISCYAETGKVVTGTFVYITRGQIFWAHSSHLDLLRSNVWCHQAMSWCCVPSVCCVAPCPPAQSPARV